MTKRKEHHCDYCWRVVCSKGALTRHVNAEHWEEKLEQFKCSDCGKPTDDETGIRECDKCLLKGMVRGEVQ